MFTKKKRDFYSMNYVKKSDFEVFNLYEMLNSFLNVNFNLE